MMRVREFFRVSFEHTVWTDTMVHTHTAGIPVLHYGVRCKILYACGAAVD